MIDYIRSIIGDMMEEQRYNAPRTNEVDSSTILEYTGLFQELDDLTESGTNTSRFGENKSGVSIPLEDDIEIDSIEMNLGDGRITDIPSDATVQEQLEMIGQKYAAMKTREDFIEEAYSQVYRNPRESIEKYNRRVRDRAFQMWREYDDRMYQEGVFGNGKINVNDLSVPDKVHIDFGATTEKDSASSHYQVTLPIRWQVDRKSRVTKKQLDSVQVWSKFGAQALSIMTDEIFKHISDKHRVSSDKKWDVLTPVEIVVPIDPSDEYRILIGFDTDYSKETTYYSLSIPIKALNKRTGKSDIVVPSGARGRTAPATVNFNAIRKRDYKLEQAELRRPRRWGGYYQEAIDFGDDGGNDAGGTPDASATQDAPPSAEPSDTAPPTDNAVDANVNDVSDQIAQNVNNITQKQAAENTGDGTDTDVDVNVDDTSTDTDTDVDVDVDNADADTNEGEEVSQDDIDANIAALDSEGEDDMGDEVADNAPSDLDDMTIDELVQQGAEKLKGMTLNQLKAFVSSPDGTTPDQVATEAYIDESAKSKAKNDKGFKGCCDNLIRRLEYIKKGIDGGWTDRDVLKCFGTVRTGTSFDFGIFGVIPLTGILSISSGSNNTGDYFYSDLSKLSKLINAYGRKSSLSRDQKSIVKNFVSSMKQYLKNIGKLSGNMSVSVDTIGKETGVMIDMVKKLRDMLPDGGSGIATESNEYSVGDQQIMMENVIKDAIKEVDFFSNASNIKKRITTAMNDVIPGLTKLYRSTESGDWDRYHIRKFWASVPYEEDPNDFSMNLSDETFKGNQFRSYVSSLQHYLGVADAKRAKSAFTESDLSTIKECKQNLDTLSKMMNKASSKLNIRNDVDISEVAEQTRIALESCAKVRNIVTSDEYAECYVQEAVFITKNNVNKEMEVHIKSSLGILNDTTNDFQKLVSDFKDESKRLNRVLSKAARMRNVYSDKEIEEIKKLNRILTDLASNIRMNKLNDAYTERVKMLIKDYAKQCKVVSNIMDLKTGKRANIQECGEGCCTSSAAPVVAKEEADTPPAPTETTGGDSGAPAEQTSDTQAPEPTGGDTPTESGDVSVGTECDKPKRFK
jgi:hypothetical protein